MPGTPSIRYALAAMRILFLDVDGVLNRVGYSPAVSLGLRSWIEPELAARLEALCRDTGARLVMSSDWRRGRSLEELGAELRAAGIETPLLDATPVLHRERWREIAAWLAAWKAAGGEEIEAFAIVDDIYDMGELAPRFARTSSLSGIDDSVAAALRALLTAA